MIERKILRTFLSNDRVPAQLEHRTIVRWISDALDARFIVFGTTETVDNGLLRISSQLIDTDSKEWKIYSAIVNLEPPNSVKDLEPVDPLPPLPPIKESSSGEKVERVGIDGTTVPSCFYMPNPRYTEDARELKLNVSVTAEAVINSQGKLENMRIVRGAPAGLNETTIASMRTWQCHPALKEGKPVPVLVAFTINFRTY